MAKETKIGIVVITVLLIVFGAVLVRRLRQPQTASAETTSLKPVAAKNGPKKKSGSAPTIVTGEADSVTPPLGKTNKNKPKWNHSYYQQGLEAEPAAKSSRYAILPDDPQVQQSSAQQQLPGVEQSTTQIRQAADDPPAPLKLADASQSRSRQYDSLQFSEPAANDAGFANEVEQQTAATRRHSAMRNTTVGRYSQAAHASHQIPPQQRQHHHSVAQQNIPSQTVSGRGNYGQVYQAQQSGNVAQQAPRSDFQQVTPPPSRNYVDRTKGTFTARPNDNFWTISKALYGTGGYFKALVRHNQSRHPMPEKLSVGDEVLAPPKERLRELFPELCPKERTRATAISAVGLNGELRGGRTYEVKLGDTLFHIAKYELGDAARWVEIYQLNQNELTGDFDYVKPGMKLVLPARRPAVREDIDRITRQPGDRLPR